MALSSVLVQLPAEPFCLERPACQGVGCKRCNCIVVAAFFALCASTLPAREAAWTTGFAFCFPRAANLTGYYRLGLIRLGVGGAASRRGDDKEDMNMR